MSGNYYPTDDDVRAIGEAADTRAEALTIEAIQQNPWHAVVRGLPENAGIELAAAVLTVTNELGDQAAKWGNRTDDAGERQAWNDLATVAQRRGETALMLNERVFGVDEPEMSRTTAAETLTPEAIRRDPWNAVRLDIPEDASIELLHNISITARELRSFAEDRAGAAQEARNPEEVERWAELAEAADFRVDDASLKLAEGRAQEAWKAPAFSYETIRADAWTAVRLPVPEQAEPELLAYARDWASDLGRYAEIGKRVQEFGSSALGEPLVNAENFTREENIAAAVERVGALDARLEQVREQMAERHRDEWELVHGAYGVEELPSQLEHRQAAETARLDEIIAWSKGSPVDPSRGLEVRLSSDEMDKWLEAQRTPEFILELEEDRSRTAFLSGTLILSHSSESLARTTDMLLKSIIEYFVPEPALTPEQARLASLAQAERNEAMEFEVARRGDAAALDGVNSEINRHQSHVRAEEPVRPDTLYERYPGLTRDDNDGRGQQVEAERAFYDTGIERSRSRGM